MTFKKKQFERKFGSVGDLAGGVFRTGLPLDKGTFKNDSSTGLRTNVIVGKEGAAHCGPTGMIYQRVLAAFQKENQNRHGKTYLQISARVQLCSLDVK